MELIKRTHATAGYAEATVAPLESTFARILAALELASQGEQSCRDQLTSQPIVARFALAMLAYHTSRAGDSDKAIAKAQEPARAALGLKTLEIMRNAISLQPTLKTYFAQEPDVSSLQDLEQFQAALANFFVPNFFV